MLPLSSKEYVTHEDSDGVVFKFVPKDGMNELASLEVFGEGDAKVIVKRMNDFLDGILIGWADPKKAGMPVFPKDNHPSKIFPMAQKTKLVTMWHTANNLSAEEKKS